LAKALNQGRNFGVKRVTAKCSGAKVVLRPDSTKSSIDLERWAVEREQPYFREVFGREILMGE